MRRAWWAALPFGAGLLASIVAVATGDGRVLVQETHLAWIWLGAGTAVALLVVVAGALRSALAARERRGRDAAEREATTLRRRFVDRLDHELKNPLTAIRLGLSNLDGAPADTVAGLEAQTLRLSRVLADLRKLGELESAQLEIFPVDIELVATEVRDAVRELPEAADRDLAVGFPRAPRPVSAVRGDADLLFLALYNVLANAVKYSRSGDRIELRGSEDAGWVTVEVADTGVGIPAAEQALVWEELSRGSLTRAVPGSGLGLPFVRTIVARHGGTVELRSREGEGTVVRMRLPVA